MSKVFDCTSFENNATNPDVYQEPHQTLSAKVDLGESEVIFPEDHRPRASIRRYFDAKFCLRIMLPGILA